MVALKSRDVARFIAAPDPSVEAILVYGPDRGLVGERSRALLARFASDPSDPFAVSILDEAEFARAPERLADELGAIAFGAARRTVFVRAHGTTAGDVIAAALSVPRAAVLIVEAGELRPQSPLRKAFEAAPDAVALPCYPDDRKALDSIIDEVLGGADQSIDSEARAALASRLGADRAASRSEIAKLSLFAGRGARITAEDVWAVCAEAHEAALDAIVDAVAEGRVAALEEGLTRALGAGVAAPRIVSAALRHFQSLHRARAAGGAPGAALASFRPPVHFTRRDGIAQQLRIWSEAELRRALAVLGGAVVDTRTTHLAPIAQALAARGLAQVATMAARRARH